MAELTQDELQQLFDDALSDARDVFVEAATRTAAPLTVAVAQAQPLQGTIPDVQKLADRIVDLVFERSRESLRGAREWNGPVIVALVAVYVHLPEGPRAVGSGG